MPSPHSEHFGQTSECSQQPLVPIAQSPDLALAYWPQLQPELNDIGLQHFSQQFTPNSSQPIGIYAHSNSEEAYPGTPESSYWGPSSCPSETASTAFPPHLLDRRGSLPPDPIPLEKIQTVDELRRVKRRAQNRAAQHAFKARKRQHELELCEKIKQVEEANAELRTENAQLKAGLLQHVESNLDDPNRHKARKTSTNSQSAYEARAAIRSSKPARWHKSGQAT